MTFSRYRFHFHMHLRGLAAVLATVSLSISIGLPAQAGVVDESTLSMTKEERIAYNQSLAVESDATPNWPTAPIVSAESAILMDADTGAILYAKNIHKQQYPASTTKILTTLIASERCTMDEIVDFSYDAVHDVDAGSNHIAIDVGEQLTMEECLNAILIRSANEVSFAVAEHISGTTWQDFAAIMNERAKELGCVDSNFVNPNGLPNENHYTSAYDLALIGRAFFANEALCKITTTRMLHIEPSERQPDDIMEVSKMELIPGGKYEYEYLVGCKTGYTDVARSTLVSCAEKNGMRLICVVLKDENPNYYEDTISLFEYGFSNFERVNISDTETKYDIENAGSFYSSYDIFGDSSPLITLNEEDCITLPRTADFEDCESTISYECEDVDVAAVITYTYHGVTLGTATLEFTETASSTDVFAGGEEETPATESSASADDLLSTSSEGPKVVFVNVFKVLLWILGIAAGIGMILLVISFFRNYQFSHQSTRLRWTFSNLKKKLHLPRPRSHRRRNHHTSRSLTRSDSLKKERLRNKRSLAASRYRKRKRPKRPSRFRDFD